jgi:hypothetical protein
MAVEKSENAIEEVRRRIEEQFNISVDTDVPSSELPSMIRLREIIQLLRDRERCADLLLAPRQAGAPSHDGGRVAIVTDFLKNLRK